MRGVNVVTTSFRCASRRWIEEQDALDDRRKYSDLRIFVAVVFPIDRLVVVISKMPAENPLKRILTALRYRVGATDAFVIPKADPRLDMLYDIGIPVVLIWYTFFRGDLPVVRVHRRSK